VTNSRRQRAKTYRQPTKRAGTCGPGVTNNSRQTADGRQQRIRANAAVRRNAEDLKNADRVALPGVAGLNVVPQSVADQSVVSQSVVDWRRNGDRNRRRLLLYRLRTEGFDSTFSIERGRKLSNGFPSKPIFL